MIILFGASSDSIAAFDSDVASAVSFEAKAYLSFLYALRFENN